MLRSSIIISICSILILCLTASSCRTQKNEKENNVNAEKKNTKTNMNTNSNINRAASFQATFPMNEYFETEVGNPYPVISQKKINAISTKKFINVMDYGARGNGTKPDDQAIIKAFAACPPNGGVIFPAGKTFLVKKLIRIPVKSNITIYAKGATFVKKNLGGYNIIAFESEQAQKGQIVHKYKVIWLGGKFDGNKDKQSYPGSPTGKYKWSNEQGNYGLLTVRHAAFALIKDVEIINSVHDGLSFVGCKLGVMSDCKASGGAPINFGEVKELQGKGRQSTYFKITRKGSEAAYLLNLEGDAGSIGIQYSTKGVEKNSISVIQNCKFHNQAQDAIHFEHCKEVFIDRCIVTGDNNIDYHPDIHIGNKTELATITNCNFENVKVDFRNATSLKVGLVEKCDFVSTTPNSKLNEGLYVFVTKATHVNECTFKGKVVKEHVFANYITNCTFEDFKVATKGAYVVHNSTFNNGKIAINNPKRNPIISESSFTNISNGIVYKGKSNNQRNSLTIYKSKFEKIAGNAVKAISFDSLIVIESQFKDFGTDNVINEKSAISGNGSGRLSNAKSTEKKGYVELESSTFEKSEKLSADEAIVIDNVDVKMDKTKFIAVSKPKSNLAEESSNTKTVVKLPKEVYAKNVKIINESKNVLGIIGQ
jgi:hypothetical protein